MAETAAAMLETISGCRAHSNRAYLARVRPSARRSPDEVRDISRAPWMNSRQAGQRSAIGRTFATVCAGMVGAPSPGNSEDPMSRSLLFPILLLVPLVAAAHAAGRTSGTHKVPVEFTEQSEPLRGNPSCRCRLARAGGPVLEPRGVLRQRWAFAAAVREARPSARPGDIFTPRRRGILPRAHRDRRARDRVRRSAGARGRRRGTAR